MDMTDMVPLEWEKRYYIPTNQEIQVRVKETLDTLDMTDMVPPEWEKRYYTLKPMKPMGPQQLRDEKEGDVKSDLQAFLERRRAIREKQRDLNHWIRMYQETLQNEARESIERGRETEGFWGALAIAFSSIVAFIGGFWAGSL